MSENQTDASTPDPSAMDAWFTARRFSALLGGLLFLTFLNVFTGQETFFYRDFGVFTYPVAKYYRERFWQGELPLWNPLSFCGIPFLAQWNTSILYPPSLFYLIFPLSWSLGVFNLLHLFLGGVGMYFLARRWLGNNFAASVAGIAFAFNGLSWHMIMWISNLAAWAWMPWVVLLVERAWREGGKAIALAALAGAMQMLSGAPEMILLTWFFCGAIWAGQFFRGTTARSTMLGRVMLVGILVAGLSAAQLLPFMDLLKHSHRDSSFGNLGWDMPRSGLANFIEPLFHCSPGGHGVFVQYDQYWTSSYYMGVGVLLLAFVAAWRVHKGRVWLLWAAALFGVLMALGKHSSFYALVKAVLPQVGFIRYPIKFVVLTVFVLPLLAAYAVRWHQQTDQANQRRTSLVSVMTVLLALLAYIVFREGKYPMGNDDWPMTWHNAIWRAAFLIAIPATLLLTRRALASRQHLLLRGVFLMLLWMDIYTHAPNLTPTVTPSVYEPNLIRAELKMDPQPHAGEPRAMQTAAAAEKVRFTSLSKPVDDYLCRRLSLYVNVNLLDDVPDIDGFFSIYLRDMAEVVGLIHDFDAQKIDLKGLKDFLGVAYISATDKSAEDALKWVGRTNYLPLVTVGQKPLFFEDNQTLANLTSPDFDPRLMVFLPWEARKHITATNRVDAKISAEKLSAQRLEMQVAAAAPTMLVVAQGFYHPWHAYVDGQRTELWRANYAFQALEVPAGQHQVKVVYEDNVFHLGVAISVGALAICAALWFWPRNKSANQGGIIARPVA